MTPRWARYTIALALLAIAVGLTAWVFREPRFQGRPVSYWMEQIESTRLENNPGLHAMGQDAIPLLAVALRTQESLPSKIHRLYGKRLPKTVQNALTNSVDIPQAAEIRRKAAFCLLAYGHDAKPVLSELYEALTDDDLEVRRLVLECLETIGPTEAAIPYLAAAWAPYQHAPTPLRTDLLKVVGSVGHYRPYDLLPAVLEGLQDDEIPVIQNAAFALDKLGVRTAEAVPHLLPMLTNKVDDVRFAATLALGTTAEPSATIRTALENRLNDPIPRIQAGAARSLLKLFPTHESALTTLASALEDRFSRKFAAEFLAELGDRAVQAVPALRKAIQQSKHYSQAELDQIACAMALYRVTSQPTEALAVLQRHSRARSRWIRAEVAEQLAHFIQGPHEEHALRTLRILQTDPDRSVRHHATRALRPQPKP